MTWLQQLQDASLGESGSALRRADDDRWRGFAFTIENLNLVVPEAAGLRIAPGKNAQPLPLCREWVTGMIPVGGEIYTVIDFARFIGRRPPPSSHVANFLLIPGEAFNSALLVDSRISLRSFAHNLPEAGDADFDDAHFGATLTPFVRASFAEGGQLWGVLDVRALMGSEIFTHIGRGE